MFRLNHHHQGAYYLRLLNNSIVFLVSNLHRVLYVVCFLLGNSPASGVYMPTFRNTICSIFIGS
jgi:hypothetical protein